MHAAAPNPSTPPVFQRRWVPRVEDVRPVVVAYCDVFLRPETLHVYRQVTAIRKFRPVVLTRRRLNAGEFPYPDVEVVARPRFFETSRVAKRLQRVGAGVLHIYFGPSGMRLLPLLRNRAVPAVVSFQGLHRKKSWMEQLPEIFQVADRIVACNESLATALLILGCDPAKLCLVRTGVPNPLTVPMVRTHPVDGEFFFIQTAKLVEANGVDRSVRAFATFSREFPKSEFLVIGDGPLRKRCLHLAKDLGVQDRVNFPGWLPRDRWKELYERAHVFLHPGRKELHGSDERCPDAILEAMADGLPIVATRHGGVPEVVEDGVSGLLVEDGDAEALGDALLKLGRNGMLLQSLSQGAAARVRTDFDRVKQARLMEDVYEQAIRNFRLQP